MKSDTTRNCHGCKHLDRHKTDGNGYCCMVVRSSQRTIKDCKLRRPDMERCELYEAGDFKTRYKTSEEVTQDEPA